MLALPDLVFLATAALIILGGGPLALRQRKKMRDTALCQFRNAKLTSTVGQYVFDGATARIIKQEESSFYARNEPYVLTLYAMNEHNEYFMFRSNNPNPYIKHMSQSIAKVVLKDKYVPPSGHSHKTSDN